jgi:hypothetical protein
LHRKNGTARGYQWRFEEDKEKILDYTNYNKNLGTINTLTL